MSQERAVPVECRLLQDVTSEELGEALDRFYVVSFPHTEHQRVRPARWWVVDETQRIGPSFGVVGAPQGYRDRAAAEHERCRQVLKFLQESA